MKGEDISEARDVDGKPHVRLTLARAKVKSRGWVEYNWKNPVSNNLELKTTYFEVTQGVIVNSGVYTGAKGNSVRRIAVTERVAAPKASVQHKARAVVPFRR